MFVVLFVPNRHKVNAWLQLVTLWEDFSKGLLNPWMILYLASASPVAVSQRLISSSLNGLPLLTRFFISMRKDRSFDSAIVSIVKWWRRKVPSNFNVTRLANAESELSMTTVEWVEKKQEINIQLHSVVWAMVTAIFLLLSILVSYVQFLTGKWLVFKPKKPVIFNMMG